MTRDEFIKLVASRAGGWIGSADSKATGLLSIAGVILGLNSLAGATAPLAFRAAYATSTFVCILSCAMVIWPRTNRKALLDTATVDTSPTFFGDLARLSFTDFLVLAAHPQRTGLLEEDEAEQAYVLARIAAKKMAWMRCAVVAFVVSLGVVSVQLVTAQTPANQAPATDSSP